MKRFELIDPENIYKTKIFIDYIRNFPELKDFFNFDPSLETVPENHIPRDNNLIEHLFKYNNNFNCTEKTLSNILSLKDPKTCVIATGQQPGLFSGPLYTIYKTITAIILADTLTKKTGKKYVPVFWIESSDSNIANISSFFYVNKENKLKDLIFPFPKEKTGASFSKITLNYQDIYNFILKFKDDIAGENNEVILNFGNIRSGQDLNLIDWFASCLTQLFSSRGLVLIDPRQTEVQKLSKPVFKKELEDPLKPCQFIQKSENLLKEKGYPPALSAFPNNTHIFLEENDQRKKLKFFEPYFQTDGSKFSRDQITSLLDARPELFSPNVALRPVLQDWLLKTSVYVAGPNETAYFAQLKELYYYHNISMPLIYPRYGATIIPDFISGLLSRSGLSIMDFQNRLDKKIQQPLRQNPELKQIFNYLFPQQVLQERRLNIIQFLTKYGFEFIDELFEVFSPKNQAELQSLMARHYFIYL
ncbi:MAG: bacillithiol biosynthesis cysteine-adding enzyme BshC [bacterium]|nr:bacillithiol biosynthesis cysteine-adding enzyme BshC [bacterium]